MRTKRDFLISLRIADFIKASGQKPHKQAVHMTAPSSRGETSKKSTCPQGRSTYAATIGFDLLYAFVIIRLDRRDLVWISATANPTAE